MGWEIGYDHHWHRDVGYGVPAYCDHPECVAEIDRGLSYVCGGEPFGGSRGCGLYFCGAHLLDSLCYRCHLRMEAFTMKPEHPKWVHHKMTDPSWAGWRRGAGIDGGLTA